MPVASSSKCYWCWNIGVERTRPEEGLGAEKHDKDENYALARRLAQHAQNRSSSYYSTPRRHFENSTSAIAEMLAAPIAGDPHASFMEHALASGETRGRKKFELRKYAMILETDLESFVRGTCQHVCILPRAGLSCVTTITIA